MKYFTLYIFFCLMLFGCNNSNTNNYKEFSHIEEIIDEYPDSALLLIKKINQQEIKGEEAKAKYALLYSQVLDKNYIDITNDSIIKYAVEYYKNNGNTLDRAKCFYYLGVIYNNANKLDTAIEAYTKAIYFAKKIEYNNILGLAHNALANALYSQNCHDDALSHFYKANEAFEKDGNLKNVLYSTQSIAYSLQSLNRLNEAQEQYHKALNIAVKQKDTLTFLDISRALASLYLEEDNAKYAKTILFKSFKSRTNFTYKEYPLLASIYLREQNIDSATFYINEALKNQSKYSNYHKIGLYQLLSSIEKINQNYKQSLLYLQKASDISNSLKKKERNSLVIGFEKKYKTKQLQELYDQTKKYNNLLTISTILIILLITLISYIILLKRKEILKKKELEIENKNNEIAQYIQNIETIKDENNSIIEKYDEAISKFNNIYKNRLNDLIKEKEDIEQKLECAIKSNRTQELINIDTYTEQQKKVEQKYINFEADYANKIIKLRKSMDSRISSMREILNIAYIYDDETLFKIKIGNLMFQFKQNNQISNLLSDLINISSLCDNGLCDYLKYKYKFTEEEIFICCLVNLGFKTNQISVISDIDEGSLNNKRSVIINKLLVDHKTKNRLEIILKEIQNSLPYQK